MPVAAQSSGKNRISRWPLLRLLGLLTIPLILILLALLQARQFDQADALSRRVDASFEARAQIRSILSLHQDIETGQRGFILTGNSSFLEPYEQAKPKLEPALGGLRQRMELESDSSFEQLEDLTRKKVAFSEQVIRLRQQGRSDDAARLIAQGQGKAIMDQIRAVVAGLDSIERQNLRAATARADASRSEIQLLTFALEALLLLLLAGAGWVISRSMAATRAAADELRDLTARQQAIFDAATDGMITHDPKGIIESLNPAAARMYGYEEEDLVGRHICELFQDPPEQRDLESFLARLARNPAGKASRVQEFGALRSDGSTFAVDVGTSPVPLADGMHFLAIVRDVTERKRVEMMKTEFVSTVSHELRTPLTSIAGSFGLLAGGAAGELPQRAAALIKIAHSNSERLVRLINDILDIEKIESGKMDFDIQPVPLFPLAEQVIQANAAYANEYGVSLRLDAKDEGATVLADPDRLVQVLTNLISNAAKFSPKGEEVVITIEPGTRTHRISVADKGPGISDDFKTRIFSKFAQADASDTREKGGTGLGLSIVRQIVLGLGGSVSFDTEESQGTTFHVDLPAAPATPADPPAQSRDRILICQEDAAAAGEIKRSLLDGGFESDVAASSQDVRRLTAEAGYAAVLLDLSLPGEEAISLIGHLRSDPRYASTPILIAASHGCGDVSQALAVVDWIHKPASVAKLVEGIEEAVARADHPCILHIEDDPDVCRVVSSAFDGRADLEFAADLDAARAALRRSRCDLVILDLALPGGSGLELLPEMRREDGTPIPVVIFSAQDDDPALARRVEAMLTKSKASLGDLVAAVEAVLADPDQASSREDP
ncbi:MAG TPA: CHASE3 domain-containing protein [Allosphingosinicella sp.]|nr:CHASE3 domain-containing protein [Allosphingosinicella sp.]